MHRLAVAVLTLALMLGAATAAPAPANFGGLYPTYDDGGEAVDSLMSNDNLWVYTLSDVAGGDVCIVPATLVDPGTGNLTCSSPAWGTKNHIGSSVGSRWTLIETPYLRSGTWKLLGDGGSNVSVDVFSNDFTVHPCQPGACDTRIADAVAQQYKLAAANMALAMLGMQGVTALLTKIAPTEPFGQFKNWLNGIVDKAASSSQIWLRIVADEAKQRLKPITDLPDGPQGMALTLLKQVVDGALEMYMDIVNDPPSDYAQVAEPVFDVPDMSSGDVALDAMILDVAQMTGYGTAGRIAFERYQQAALENSDAGVHRQAIAIAENNYALVENMYGAAEGFEVFADKLAADPEWAGAKVVQEHIDALRPFVTRVNTTGLHPDEEAELDALGLDAAAKAELLAELKATPLDDTPVDKPFEDVLREAAATLRTEAVAFDAMARAADAAGQSTNSSPVAGFTASTEAGAPPLHVEFTDASSDPDVTDDLVVTWDFGDGSALAEGKTVAHDFAEGEWTVTQTVSDGLLSATATRTITVAEPNAKPTASFTATPSEGVAPLEVAFDASASGDPDGSVASYAWDFGDGETGSGVTAQHAYATAGAFIATLTVTDDKGATATATRTITVSTAGNAPPVAAFTVTPASGPAPLQVALDASGSTDDGTIAHYAWDFGDGTTGEGVAPTHEFAAGTWEITLTVTDDDGATAAVKHTVTANGAPLASFTMSATSGHVPLTVHFDASGSSDDVGVVSYEWDFGDGSSGSGAKPSHTYTATGNFSVELTVTDGSGVQASTQQVVFAQDNVAPVASFSMTPENGPPPLEVSFTDGSYDSNGDPLTADWDFGDGSSGSGHSVKHTYAAAGLYTVELTVGDGLEEVTASKVVRVTAPPVAAFTSSAPPGQPPYEIDFDAAGSADPDGSIKTYHWSFGDGDTASGESPQTTHVYARNGRFTVVLTVTDDLGESDQQTHAIEITGPPAPVGDVLTTRGAGAIDVLANDAHPNDRTFELVGTGAPLHGTADCDEAGACLYRPDDGHTGTDEFVYRVRDQDGREATATVQVDVLPPVDQQQSLLVRDDDVVTRAGQPVAVAPLANDEGEGPLKISATGDPQHGDAECQATGACTYTPADGFSGTDGFTYTVQDANDAKRTGAVHVTVAPATSGFPPAVGGRPVGSGEAVRQGELATWQAAAGFAPDGIDGAALGALPPPKLTVDLTGAHGLETGTTATAPGWSVLQTRATSGALEAQAGPGALLGEAVSTPLPRPLPPISQGTGGDGHVPILVGSKVFAFFHHSFPTSISCADRRTGALCPGYPKPLTMGATDIPGPAAVIGSRFWVHLHATAHPAQYASVSLLCWNAATDETCGIVTLDRVKSTNYADGSAPVVVGGKIYVAADENLYCYDPEAGASCAVARTPHGLGKLGPTDILANGTRVYVAGAAGGKVACVDVSSSAPCAGWNEPQSLSGRWNLVRRHAADGAVSGMCAVTGGSATCFPDAQPDQRTEYANWPAMGNYYEVTQEAEAGTRTLLATHGRAGAACWDWATLAPCTGGGFDADGWIDEDVNGNLLPTAYGIAWDGSCAVGLGDPGLIFTVDPSGSAPCTSLGTGTDPVAVDLRDQRCDGTVGAATWTEIELLDTPASGSPELSSLIVTVRDGETGEKLLSQELIGGTGKLSLASIDPAAHPALRFEATAVSKAGDPAWVDGLPPRVRIRWQSDPAQLCLKTRAAVACDAVAPIGVSVAGVKKELPTLRSTICNDPPVIDLGADRAVDEQALVTIDPTVSDPQGTKVTFALLDGPDGASLDPADGRVTWSPAESQGPGTYTVRVRASDGSLTSEDTLVITVREVNRSPSIQPLAARTLRAGETLTATALASDPDVPANRLTFSILSPVGPSVDPATGAISWKPAAPGAFPVTVRVTDDGSPPMSADAVLAATVENPPAEILLECAKRDLVLEDVVAQGRRVEFFGVADARFNGRAVEIVYEMTGKVVASLVVGPDGTFHGTAPSPPRAQRHRARYVARIGDERSLNLKLERRMIVTGVRPAAGSVTFTGRVIGPFARRRADRVIEIRRRVSCGKDEVVGKARPAASGSFRITVPAPAGVEAAVYRFRTKVRATARSRRPTDTFTLPRVVLFASP